jgi:predicted dehydrogenase
VDQVKLAMIGVNYPHARYRDLLRSIPDEVEIVAFYDPDPTTARGLLHASQRDVPVYDDVDELLQRHAPEAAMVFLPNNVRPRMLTRLADAGLHVFAEKPVATHAAALRETAATVERKGIVFYPGYQWRRHPMVRTVKEMVDRGLLGELTLIELRYVTSNVTIRDPTHLHFSREIAGGGFLNWLGCHWFDLARYVTSREVTGVMAFTDNLSGEAIDVESVAAVALRFDNGMLGTLNCGYVQPEGLPHQDNAYLGLRGTLGWVEWPLFTYEATVASAHADWFPATVRKLRYEVEPFTEGYGGAEGIALVRDWINAFRHGGPRLATIDDAIKALEIIDAAYESSASGRRVELAGGRR